MKTASIISARVYLWGNLIGYVHWDNKRDLGRFEYDSSFLKSPVEPAPLFIKKDLGTFEFPALGKDTYHGLPGFLADSLPDKFGNALIDVWLAQQGRTAASFNPVERLCYIGSRGMGALEFKPTVYKGRTKSVSVDIDKMVELASDVLNDRKKLKLNIKNKDEKKKQEALTNLLVIGSSAGGARAKCIIAYNEKTGVVRSGQIKAGKDFSYWLLKLDGVTNNKDKELSDPKGFGRIEHAYYKMAVDCKIKMMESRLLEENGRAHFMTKRFDRLDGGEKIHMQSLCGIAHFDFNMAGAYSYEQAFEIIRKVVVKAEIPEALEQQFRRAVFNVIGRNQDDHTKNIAFLMNKIGEWNLSPAYDISYSYNPKGAWTNKHQMQINGKADNFSRDDLIELGRKADLKKVVASRIIDETIDVFQKWSAYAKKSGVGATHVKEIKAYLRLKL